MQFSCHSMESANNIGYNLIHITVARGSLASMSSMATVLRTSIHLNLSANALFEHALQRKEGTLAVNGALSVNTGKRTGRSPKDRFIVRDAVTDSTVQWNAINQPVSPAVFDALWEKAL